MLFVGALFVPDDFSPGWHPHGGDAAAVSGRFGWMGRYCGGYLQRYRLPLGVFLTVGGLILASLYAGNHLDPFCQFRAA